MKLRRCSTQILKIIISVIIATFIFMCIKQCSAKKTVPINIPTIFTTTDSLISELNKAIRMNDSLSNVIDSNWKSRNNKITVIRQKKIIRDTFRYFDSAACSGAIEENYELWEIVYEDSVMVEDLRNISKMLGIDLKTCTLQLDSLNLLGRELFDKNKKLSAELFISEHRRKKQRKALIVSGGVNILQFIFRK